ncbi:hypothetical protein [Sphaerochaeta sp.]|uniref:hypothetical protein n=1 Tax=Sphaerochaeta sp. TaxID=1972642 RepID=UPI003D0A2DE1
MLNELYSLAESLSLAGITPEEWHPQLKPLPKASAAKPCYRISIGDETSVTSVKPIDTELTNSLRKWEPSNGNSFPGFNIQPLYRICMDSKCPHHKENLNIFKKWVSGKEPVDMQMIESWMTAENNNWDIKAHRKLTQCLCEIPKKLLQSLPEDDKASDLKRVIKFASGFIDNAEEAAAKFRISLENYLLNCVLENRDTEMALNMLIYGGSCKKNLLDDRGSLSVFIDTDDFDNYPIAHAKTVSMINQALIGSKKDDTDETDCTDAFGYAFNQSDEKLAGVKLQYVAEVKLRAMNSESPCQKRYGLIDAASYPIGQNARTLIKGALEWLSRSELEGITWGRTDNTKELLFAYPKQLPPVPVSLASAFGVRSQSDAHERFADAVTEVISSLKGISRDLKNIEIEIFSLKKMDKARTKVVFHRNYTAQRLADAADSWQAGAANIPELSLRVWGSEKGKTEKADIPTPFPLEAAPVINKIWKQDGKLLKYIPVINPCEGVELMLSENPEAQTFHLLSKLVQNAKGLLISQEYELNSGNALSLQKDRDRILILPLIGILLSKIGINKEEYMQQPSFLVGKMLKIADEIHELYCKDVRGSAMPGQLIGNSMMTAALDSPVQALAQLGLRIKPYYGWAQTNKNEKTAGLSRYLIKLCGETAEELSKHELPQRLNDAEKAQLLLGYLASHPKKNETEIK